jgi:hypothetical protein
MSFLEFHRVGGMPFMAPLTVILIANLLIVAYASFLTATKKPVHLTLIELVRHIGGFALAFGGLSTVVGFFFALQALSEATDVIPFEMIMGGLAVGLITVEYGFVIFLISLLCFMVLKYLNRNVA